MHTAKNLAGDDLVVLSRAEFEALSEDVGDAALAAAARAEDAGKPGMASEYMEQVLAGDMTTLEAWRRSCGFTHAKLAEASGVRAATISHIENSKTDPRVSTMRALAEAMNLEIADVLD